MPLSGCRLSRLSANVFWLPLATVSELARLCLFVPWTIGVMSCALWMMNDDGRALSHQSRGRAA